MTAIAALLLLSPLCAVAGTTQRPVIVELYTSEGCSSCPPAEALIEEIARQPGVLPLAFHVDYWDDLGWRDRFSMKQATQRQRDLASALRLPTVGTPQLIVDGRESVWGADRQSLIQALKAPRSDVPVSAQREDRELVVRTPSRTPGEVYDVYVVGYLPRTVTPIGRGENAGRTLTEVNVVRDIRRLGQSGSTPGEWRISVDSFPKDASRAVVFLQRPGNGAIAGATALDLRDIRPAG
jgi:hypothetical protein